MKNLQCKKNEGMVYIDKKLQTNYCKQVLRSISYDTNLKYEQDWVNSGEDI